MVQLTGGCLCGKIRIVANGEPLRVGICHCMDCRKHHGALLYAATACSRSLSQQINKGPQAGRYMAVIGVVKRQASYVRAPILKHRY
ncbi:GFA family protein [Halomonas sp.]|uniref:GFA family protein n=1 Tax=unclassified Halomonas TaxID=2609666 RepID=UPI0039F3DBA9